jgi:hypothetical protein
LDRDRAPAADQKTLGARHAARGRVVYKGNPLARFELLL